MSDRAQPAITRRLGSAMLAAPLLGGLLLAAAGCVSAPVDAPPKSVVFFNAFSADLDDPAHAVINQVAADATANPRRTVIVEGYADKTGSVPANQTLSQLRAQVVADALTAGGVAPARIVIHPRGPTTIDPGIESRRVEVSFGP